MSERPFTEGDRVYVHGALYDALECPSGPKRGTVVPPLESIRQSICTDEIYVKFDDSLIGIGGRTMPVEEKQCTLCKVGPPRKELTEKQLEQLEALAGMAAPQEEIASFFGISVDTLTRNYAEIIKRGKASVSSKVRLKQLQVAFKQNHPTMLIWLGKQLCGQRDKRELEVTDPAKYEFVDDDE